MFYLSEEFYSMEQKLNANFYLFQPFGKIKIAGSYNTWFTHITTPFFLKFLP